MSVVTHARLRCIKSVRQQQSVLSCLFLDLACPSPCPLRLTSQFRSLSWQPGAVYFATFDDRYSTFDVLRFTCYALRSTCLYLKMRAGFFAALFLSATAVFAAPSPQPTPAPAPNVQQRDSASTVLFAQSHTYTSTHHVLRYGSQSLTT